MTPLITLLYFAEATQVWKIEGERVTGGCSAALKNKAVQSDRIGNVKYSFAMSKYISQEFEVSKSALEYAQGVCQLMFSFEAVLYETQEWQTKVRIGLGSLQ